MRLRIGQQLASSLFFLGFGAGALWLSTEMPIGTAAEMGVGYVPRLLAIGCLAVGIIQFATGLLFDDLGEPVAVEFKPLVLVAALIVGFATLLPDLGLPLTILLMVGATALSGEAFDWRLLLLAAVLLAAGAGILFCGLLRLQIPLWPMWWPL